MGSKKLSVLLAFVVTSACSPHTVRVFDKPAVTLPETYAEKLAQKHQGEDVDPGQWWKAYESEKLNTLVDSTLKKNLTLKAAWERLKQAQEQSVIAGSELYPQVSVNARGLRRRSDVTRPFATQFTQNIGVVYENNYSLVSSLSYELDIWKRIQSSKTAASLRTEAVRADVEQTALMLIGSVVETYLKVQEQRSLLELLDDQITTAKTFLELTELRFAVGQGSALDVYQQRTQLAATEAQKPMVEAGYKQALNQIAILTGNTPVEGEELGAGREDILDLPPFPDLVSPALLLDSRPDLRQARLGLQAGEFDLAAAVAERYPQLSLGFNYSFQTNDIKQLFTSKIGDMAAGITTPLIDGGRRRAAVRQQEAVVDQLLYEFSDTYLTALTDVENAVIQEKHQLELVEKLNVQLQAARSTLSESRLRYMNGLSDYLQVILALQSVQELERRVVSEKTNLLIARARLYRALGGQWLTEIQDSTIGQQV